MKIHTPFTFRPLLKKRAVEGVLGPKEDSGKKKGGIPSKVQSVLSVLLTLLPIAILIFILLKIHPGEGKNDPQPSPKTISQNQSQEQGKETGTNRDEGESKDDKPTNKKCCTSESGEQIPYPEVETCFEYDFGKSLRNLDGLLSAVDEAGLKLVGVSGQMEFNGYVSSVVGQTNLSKYAVYLYTQDAINYEYDPPYRYKATSCSEELKDKLTKAFEGVK